MTADIERGSRFGDVDGRLYGFPSLTTVSFPEVCDDDHEIVNRSAFLYDSFYEALKKLTATRRS